MEYLKILVQVIGHIAWPIVVLTIAIYFKKEVSALLRRVTRAKYKGVELDLENAFQEVKTEAIDAGITVAYPASSFSQENFDTLKQAPELVFIKSWQEIENLLTDAYKRKVDKGAKTPPISLVIVALVEHSVLGSDMASIIGRMYEIRNNIVHSTDFEITRGELLEWLGLSRSITDRLTQQLQG